VGLAGQIVIDLIERVRPVLLECLSELANCRQSYGQGRMQAEAPAIIKRYRWPRGYRPSTYAEFRQRCRQAQTATMFLLSLLIGPRSSEVLSLPRRRIKIGVVNGSTMYFLNGLTFKLSKNRGGSERDWPIDNLLGMALDQQERYIDLTEGENFKYLWKQHQSLFEGGDWLRDVDGQLEDFVQQFSLEPALQESRCHHHRFRKTTARLIVIALYGGPVILRRLFGHEHLAMTLRYIMANSSIIDELREIAEEEQRQVAVSYVKRSEELLGKGGEQFRATIAAAVEALEITVPDGKREQGEFNAEEVIAFLSDGADGLAIKQLIPGMVGCFKPRDESGMCCTAQELPNIAKCSAECKWQAMFPEYRAQAELNLGDALAHLAQDPNNPLIVAHYREVVVYWIDKFPELAQTFREHEACHLSVCSSTPKLRQR
jgi:hypothetical protein